MAERKGKKQAPRRPQSIDEELMNLINSQPGFAELWQHIAGPDEPEDECERELRRRWSEGLPGNAAERAAHKAMAQCLGRFGRLA